MIYLTPGFRKKLADDTRDYIATADITLASGEVLNLTNTEIWGDGFEVEDAVSDDENFTALGATVIGAATLVIDNTSGQYTKYDFMNADVVLKVALMIDDTTGTRKEDVKMGTFRVDSPQYNEVTINLSMLDYMEQFDRPYSLSKLVYPATLGAIVRDACTVCGVTQNTLTFPHDDFEVQERPADESTTFREVLSWAATIAGCFAKVNRDGELVIKWFNTAALEDDSGTDGGYYDDGTPYYTSGDSVDGGSFNPWSTGSEVDGGDFTTEIPVNYIGSLYQQNICVDDTVITAVSAEVEDKSAEADQQKKTFISGTDGYTIKITGNPFLTLENAQEVVNWLGEKLNGLRFRKCNVTHTDDPAIEAGDVGILFDSKQNEYKILITRQRFEIGSPQTIVCGCDTPSHNSATRFSEATKSYVAARKLLKEQVNQYEQAMDDLREDIENNAHGLYAEEIEDPDNPGSYIYCLHDKPSLEQSAVRIHISTIGVAVTANATAQSPDWYAFRVNGDLLARVIQTMNLFFDYAHGGTLTLGGENNVNGLIRVLDASGNEIGSWSKDGLSATGDLAMVKGDMRSNIGLIDQAYWKRVEGQTGWRTAQGFATRLFNGSTPTSQYAIFPEATKIREQAFSTNAWEKEILIGAKDSSTKYAIISLDTSGVFKVSFVGGDYNIKLGKDTGIVYDAGGLTTQASVDIKGNLKVVNGASASFSETAMLLKGSGSSYNINVGSNVGINISAADSSGNVANIHSSKGSGFSANCIQIDEDSSLGLHNGAYISMSFDGAIDISQKLYGNTNYLSYTGNRLAYDSSSARRYKHDIKPIEADYLDPHRLLALPIVQFVWNDNHPLQYGDMAGKTIPGIIAEDVDNIYPAATIRNLDTGEVESWDERRIIPGMLALIQEQDRTIKEQQARLDELEKKLENLTKMVEFTMNR